MSPYCFRLTQSKCFRLIFCSEILECGRKEDTNVNSEDFFLVFLMVMEHTGGQNRSHRILKGSSSDTIVDQEKIIAESGHPKLHYFTNKTFPNILDHLSVSYVDQITSYC